MTPFLRDQYTNLHLTSLNVYDMAASFPRVSLMSSLCFSVLQMKGMASVPVSHTKGGVALGSVSLSEGGVASLPDSPSEGCRTPKPISPSEVDASSLPASPSEVNASSLPWLLNR